MIDADTKKWVDEDEQDEAADDDYANNFGGGLDEGAGLGNIDFSKLGVDPATLAAAQAGEGGEAGEAGEGDEVCLHSPLFYPIVRKLTRHTRRRKTCLNSSRPTTRKLRDRVIPKSRRFHNFPHLSVPSNRTEKQAKKAPLYSMN